MKKKSTFFAGAFIAAALLLSGCQNFLNANAEAREKLQAEADYNRASSINVSAYVENSSHGVITKTVTEAKVGYPFQVRFNCADEYYAKSWAVKNGSRSLSEGTDYAVKEMGNGTYEITVKSPVSSIELIPECYKQPIVTFMNPKEYSGDGYESVKGESINYLGSQMVKVGETYLINLKTDKGYKIDAIKIKKDGRDLSDFENIVAFSGKKIIDGIYQEKIKFLSHEADGIEICPIAIVGSNDADNNTVLGAPVLTIDAARTSLYSYIPAASFRVFDNLNEDSYYKISPQYEGYEILNLYLKQTAGNPLEGFYVEERVMKIPSDSIIKDKNNKWIDGDKVGQCYSKTYDFLKGDVLNEDDYLWKDTVDGWSISDDEWSLSLRFNLYKPGWHQWNVWAISKDKDGTEIRSDIPIVFVAKVDNIVGPYYDYDGLNYNMNYFYSTIITHKPSVSTGTHGTGQTLFICISSGDRKKIHAITFQQSNTVSQGIDATNLVFNNAVDNEDGYGIMGGYRGARPHLQWQVTTPFLGVENTIECFWADKLGNKGQSTVYTYKSAKAVPGQIALAKVNNYYCDYVTYMSYEDYDVTWANKHGLTKIGYVYYADDKNVLVVNPTVGAPDGCKWGYNIPNLSLNSNDAIKFLDCKDYSVEKEYERISDLHKQLGLYKISVNETSQICYPAMNIAYNMRSRAGDYDIYDIGWCIPSEEIIKRYMTEDAMSALNKWSDSPFKGNNAYWTCTMRSNGYSYFPVIYYYYSSNKYRTNTNYGNVTKVNSDSTLIKVLTITNLGDKRYQEVTKD